MKGFAALVKNRQTVVIKLDVILFQPVPFVRSAVISLLMNLVIGRSITAELDKKPQ